MNPQRSTPTLGRRLLEILVVALLYHAGAQLGFLLQSLGTLTSPVWPPSGIAFAALLICGLRVWPGIFLGAFSANLAGFLSGSVAGLGGSVASAFAIATGNTLEGVVGVLLLRRFVTSANPVGTPRDVFGFVVVTMAMCAVGATNGAVTLLLSGFADAVHLGALWLTWWLGDTVGVLVLTPLLTVWWGPHALRRVARRPVESVLAVGAVLAMAALVFGVPFAAQRPGFPLTFLLLPPLLWAAYRFEHRGATLAIATVATLSIWATYRGFGPFAVAERNDSLLLLQGFIAVSSMTILAMAAVIHDRRRAMEAIRASQDSLLQAQKMEAVGRLAGGIAHDFNNLLMVISGHAELMLVKNKTPEDSRAHAERIHEASKRGAGLVKQLLAYSRRQLLEPRALDLNALVNDMGQLLRRVIGEHVELTMETANAPTTIFADPNNIERVVLNLSINARDAMKDGGTLTIGTESVQLDAATASSWKLPPGPCAIVSVADTGTGIDPAILPEIFDPFFTTKEVSSGTGLGLATVYGIVQQSGGHIDVESTLGRGTVFRVYLPLVDACILPSDESAPRPAERSGRGTILLVEDDGAVRELVARVLADHGYEVAQACDGVEARDVYPKIRQDLIAIVTDVVMPRSSGAELVQWIRSMDPRARVLFISGYSETQPVTSEMANPATGYLPKPFTTSALLSKLDELLDL